MVAGPCAMALLMSCAGNRYAGIDLRAGHAASDLQTLARAARSGDKRAQLQLGDRFARGEGIPRDVKRARDLYAGAARTTGGTLWIYSPPVGQEKSSRVIPVSTPISAGLAEAAERLRRLDAADAVDDRRRGER